MNQPINRPVFASRRMEQQWVRNQAVKLHKHGMTVKQISEVLEVSIRSIFSWLSKYQAGGQAALHARHGGGRPPTLNGAQMAELARMLRDHTPDQLQFGFGLWTLRLIAALIERHFDWSPSMPTMIKLMRLLGFTAQRPLRRAWQQDDVLVERWRLDEYPAIVARAKARGATIWFADEAGIRSDYHTGTTWAPQGRTPVVASTGARFSLQMLSAISPMGELQFMLYDGRVDAVVFVRFLEQLMLGRTQPIVLIVDGHPIHRSKLVQEYVASTKGLLELVFLPPYSPQLNPDEQVWKSVKARVSKKMPRSKFDLREMVQEAFAYLIDRTDIIASFFRHPDCRYSLA
jgi:transposase